MLLNLADLRPWWWDATLLPEKAVCMSCLDSIDVSLHLFDTQPCIKLVWKQVVGRCRTSSGLAPGRRLHVQRWGLNVGSSYDVHMFKKYNALYE